MSRLKYKRIIFNPCKTKLKTLRCPMEPSRILYTYLPQIDQDPGEGTSGGRVLIQPIDNNISYQSVSLEDVEANQTLIIGNQANIINSLAQLKSRLDYINDRVLQIESGSLGNASGVHSEVFLKPIETLEMLNELEKILKDDTVMVKYVKTMSHICGKTGKEDGLDCCYRLIDHFMTRQSLTTCSWTANSRDNADAEESNVESKSQIKVPFLMYKKIRKLFLKLVLQADNDCTAIKCEEFFKRVLKNSKQRLLAKTVSKHKNRPKNTRQQEAEQNPQC
ncbi:uncharacterized protein LOC135702919 [Ochlerotatus camptorhynchus]|uniref:uncharacterized protein LOC135702919 n=1 Tax=Ochlerotatus camptorhynchus TaxID=644619 RepID=UPI0031DC77D6